MKAALISPNEQVQTYEWVNNPKTGWFLQWYLIPNSERIAEVSTQPFDIAPPLFWVSCADNVNASEWYYDKDTQQCVQIIYPPQPVQEAPIDEAAAPITGTTAGPTVVA